MGVGKIIGGLISSQEDMKQSLVTQGETPAWFQGFPVSVPVDYTIQLLGKDIDSSAFILSDIIQGQLVSGDGGGLLMPVTFPVTFDSEIGYYLQNTGEGFVTYPERVLNKNRTYVHTFETTTLTDTTITTADLTTSSGYCYFDSAEIYRTEVVAKNNVAYTSAKLVVEGLATSNLLGSISFDGGSTFNAITFNQAIQVSNVSTSGIVANVLASSNADGNNTYLTKLKIQYS